MDNTEENKETLEEVSKDKEEQKAKLLKQAYVSYGIRQILYISQHGCSGIKCKDCFLKESCVDKRPSQSKEMAAKVIAYANMH